MPAVYINIPTQRLVDLLISAVEGGSTYWCNGIYWQNKDATPPAGKEVWYSRPELFDDPNFQMEVIEDEESVAHQGTSHIVTRAGLALGLQVMAEKYPHHLADLLAEHEDATTGDVFLQCCALGEIVYG